jgi:hypothetical protein
MEKERFFMSDSFDQLPASDVRRGEAAGEFQTAESSNRAPPGEAARDDQSANPDVTSHSDVTSHTFTPKSVTLCDMDSKPDGTSDVTCHTSDPESVTLWALPF